MGAFSVSCAMFIVCVIMETMLFLVWTRNCSRRLSVSEVVVRESMEQRTLSIADWMLATVVFTVTVPSPLSV